MLLIFKYGIVKDGRYLGEHQWTMSRGSLWTHTVGYSNAICCCVCFVMLNFTLLCVFRYVELHAFSVKTWRNRRRIFVLEICETHCTLHGITGQGTPGTFRGIALAFREANLRPCCLSTWTFHQLAARKGHTPLHCGLYWTPASHTGSHRPIQCKHFVIHWFPIPDRALIRKGSQASAVCPSVSSAEMEMSVEFLVER